MNIKKSMIYILKSVEADGWADGPWQTAQVKGQADGHSVRQPCYSWPLCPPDGRTARATDVQTLDNLDLVSDLCEL
jgi:hypothetical protein